MEILSTKVILGTVVALISFLGYMFTIKDQEWRGGVFKVLATALTAIIGIYFDKSIYLILGLSFMVIADLVLSFLKPLLKKDFLFLVGLGLFLVAYLLLSINFIKVIFDVKSFALGFAVFTLLGISDIRHMDKCDKLMKVIVFIYLSVIALLVASTCSMPNEKTYVFLGSIMLFFSDLVIGNSTFNSKYCINKVITEFLITMLYSVGLFILVIK